MDYAELLKIKILPFIWVLSKDPKIEAAIVYIAVWFMLISKVESNLFTEN